MLGGESNGFRSVCLNAPTSPNVPMPIQCTPGTYCYSADGMYAMECQCGVNDDGNAYCPLFPGDSLY